MLCQRCPSFVSGSNLNDSPEGFRAQSEFQVIARGVAEEDEALDEDIVGHFDDGSVILEAICMLLEKCFVGETC